MVRKALNIFVIVVVALGVVFAFKTWNQNRHSSAKAREWNTEAMDAAYPVVKQDPKDPLKDYPVVKHDK